MADAVARYRQGDFAGAQRLCNQMLRRDSGNAEVLHLLGVTLMAAGGLEILFATYQFPNGGTGFWGVATGSAAPFRGPAWATTPFVAFIARPPGTRQRRARPSATPTT